MPQETDALADACRRLAPAIYRRCLKILRNPDDAKDACQKVFLQIVRHRASLPPPEEQLRWAYVIATRICLSVVRDGRWETDGGESAIDETAQVSGGFESLADRQLAQRALAAAGEDERMVAWLVLVDGHTQEEAAQLLGLSRKTIGKRIHLFLAEARRLLGGA